MIKPGTKIEQPAKGRNNKFEVRGGSMTVDPLDKVQGATGLAVERDVNFLEEKHPRGIQVEDNLIIQDGTKALRVTIKDRIVRAYRNQFPDWGKICGIKDKQKNPMAPVTDKGIMALIEAFMLNRKKENAR